ncbi:hypothetical protein [Aeromonas veronii]|uniref:hypothetical protein n=1 Tax=Aeromonas veronii TaxID=654 RepID=UPI002936FDDB|nr:hypothetical protein [Aeromonas veronii]WOE86595.1 hypothetical protein RY930_09570 [Aeromonas veronii]
MERLIELFMTVVFNTPFLKIMGKSCISLSMFAIGAGLIVNRFERRIDRVSHNLQALTDGHAILPQPPGLFDYWPLIDAFVPESIGAFLLYIALLISGIAMVHLGKQIERML